MCERYFRGPISLEAVHTDVTVGGHVGVVDLRQEEASGGRVREVVAQNELDVKRPSIVGRSNCSKKHARGWGAGIGGQKKTCATKNEREPKSKSHST